MKVAELLSEGFSGFTVSGSDNAWDLNYEVEEAVEKQTDALKKKAGSLPPDNVIAVKTCETAISVLKKGIKERGNEYNIQWYSQCCHDHA